jgi:hypothetical protein
LRVGFDLFAQVTNVYVDGTFGALENIAGQMFQQVLPGQDATGGAHESGQQIKFRRSQFDWLRANGHLAATFVKNDIGGT